MHSTEELVAQTAFFTLSVLPTCCRWQISQILVKKSKFDLDGVFLGEYDDYSSNTSSNIIHGCRWHFISLMETF
jgi:hypothetical protein